MVKNRGTVFLALILIILGSYLLLSELNPELPGWRSAWPIFPLAGGVALLIDFVCSPRRDADRVFLGTAATLVSAVLLLVTMGPLNYSDLTSWWPTFVIIGGIAFLAQWAARRFRDWDALFLGVVALTVGGAAFAVRLELLGPNTRELLPRLWPAILILAGLMALIRGLLERRTH
jgi:hypothetical protein